MDRLGKEKIIKEMESVFQTNKAFYFLNFKGLKVQEISELREKIKESDGSIRVVKNTLLKKAVSNVSINGMDKFFEGPTAIAWSKEDPVSVAKIITNFAKDNPNLKIKGGLVEGNLLDEKGVEAISKLPQINEIRAQLIGLLQAPMSKLIRVLKTPATNIVVCLKERSKSENNQ